MTKALLLATALVASGPAWAADAAGSGVGATAQDAAARPLTPEERAQAIQELQDLQIGRAHV